MDDFDDIDGLVEMEMELNGEEAGMEPVHPASAQKRGGPRTSKDVVHQLQADLDDCDDEELMQLAMESQPELDDIDMAAAHCEERDVQAQALVPQNGEQDSDLWPRRQEIFPLRNAFDVVGDCINVTSSSGERVYAPVGPSGSLLTVNGPGGIAASIRRIRGTLLSNTIEELMSAVERDQFERVLSETAAEVRMQDQENQSPQGKPPPGSSSSPSPPSSSPLPPPKKKKTIHKPSQPHSLWVDKYAPKSFMDLLSDEKTNREVVGWLKSWDQCVFGTKKSSATQRVKTHKLLQSNQSTDPLGRPHHKVILLAGPPGLGKTTLAHVVARHCGYRPVEINASDNRNATTLLSRVLDAVEMRSVMGEKRPNCLIIDEIDGAAAGGAAAEGKGAIAMLLKVIQAAPRSPKPAELAAGIDEGDHDDDYDDDDHDEGDHGKSAISKSQTTRRHNQISKSRRQKKQQFRPLMRPIICICNDLYAPVLRPLRDVASVFHFRRPSPERLTHRLQMVCNAEGMQAEKSTLRMLAERSECDIRSCLNTLQFISKKQRIVRHSDVLTLGLGQKDTTKGAFRVWEELLHVKKTSSVIGRVPESPNDRSMRLYSMLSDFGDTELIITGMFETLPTLKFFDMGLHRTVQVLSNIQDVDRLLKAGWKDPQLMRYLPAPTLRTSSLISGPERPIINWPREDGECRRKYAAQKSLLQTWMSRMTPQTLVVSMATSGMAIIHLLSMLPNVLTPSLRPVSRHLYSKEEQECLNNLVNSLLCLGLLYSQSDGGDGNQDDDDDDERQECDVALDPPLFFTPPVHKLWKFGRQSGGTRLRTMPLATRQLVGHEVELESIRRAQRVRVDQTGQSSQSVGAPPVTHQSFVPLNLAQRLEQTSRKVVTKSATTARASSWLDQLKSRAKSLQVRGRNGGKGSSERCEMDGEKTKILYKYHEGYTNAVKRPIRMYELL